MSPTSCHCSTPRWVRELFPTGSISDIATGECAQRPRLPHGSPCSTLRRCHGARPGSGWDWVEPWRSRPRTHPRCAVCFSCWIRITHSSCDHRRPGGVQAARSGDEGTCPSDLISEQNRPRPLVRLGSSWLPTVHRPPIDPVVFRGSYLVKASEKAHLEAGFPLRCCQRLSLPNVATQRCTLPYNWHTSGSSSPVLSY